jgi:hypothetical protein
MYKRDAGGFLRVVVELFYPSAGSRIDSSAGWGLWLGFLIFTAFLPPVLAQTGPMSVRPGSVPGQAEVSVGSQTDKFYQLEVSRDLKDWWAALGTNGTGSNLTYTVDTTGQDRLFFRFVIEQNGLLRGLTNLVLAPEAGFSEVGERAALILASNGVASTDDLFNRFRSVSRLNQEVARLQQSGVRIDAGNVIGLLKEAELRTNLKSLEEKGFRKSLTDVLVSSRFNMTELHRFMRRVPADAGALLAQEAYLEFKNTLQEVGSCPLSQEEFHQLRAHVASLNPVPDLQVTQSHQDARYGTLPGAAKRLATAQAKDGTLTNLVGEAVSSLEEQLSKLPPPSYDYIPAYVQQHNQARFLLEPYPLAILGYRLVRSGAASLPVPIDALPPFTVESENPGYRKFLINESGLAWFKAYGHAQGAHLLIRNSTGQTILDEQIPANSSRGFILPIFQEDVGAGFEVLKVDGLTLSAMSLQKPLVAENVAGEFRLQDQSLTPVVPSLPGGAAWLRFSLLDSPGAGAPPLVASLQVRNSFLPDGTYQTVLINPSRVPATNCLTLNHPLELPFQGQNGLWNLFILPPGIDGAPLIRLNPVTGQVDALSLFALNADTSSGESAFDFVLQHAPVQTRAFLVGKMNQVAYSRDGESAGSFGEVKLSFHANIAPYFDQAASFGSVFGESRAFQAWRLWLDNGQNAAALALNEQFVAGLAELRLNEAFRSEYLSSFYEFFPYQNSPYSFYDDNDLLTVYSAHVRNELGRSWYRNIGDAAALYQSWADRVVQINAFKYPFGQQYKIVDNLVTGSPLNGTLSYLSLHPVIPVDVPLFAVPKDRMAREPLPISFDYATWEMDELDKSDLFGSALKGVVNVGLGILGQNWARAVCSGVDMIDELHRTVKAAKDDPIGSANFRLSRASSRHGFYGLEDDELMSFHFSGKPKKNNLNAFETGLNYAKLACDTMTAVSSVGGNLSDLKKNLSSAWSMLSSGNLSDLEGLKSILLLAAGENAAKILRVEEFISRLKAGQLTDNFEATLELASLSETLTAGTDLYDTFAGLAENLKGMSGMGSLGFNLVHSECYFHFNGYTDRKTTAQSSVGIVRSVPARSISVVLDKVEVFDLKEELLSLPAEIFINSRVGIIADQAPVAWTNVDLQFTDAQNQLVLNNGSQGFATCPNVPFVAYAKRSFPKVDFMRPGAYAPWSRVDNTLLQATWSSNVNTAAIYLELGVYENDGDNIDDDMLGVYSRTFLLEDILKSPGVVWQQTGDRRWRLEVKDYPVYDASNLETVVEPQEGDMKTRQQTHNIERLSHPSALVNFHIDLELADLVHWADTNSYNLQPGNTTQSLSNINLRVVGQGGDAARQIMDVRGGQALARLEPGDRNFLLGLFDVTPTNAASAIRLRGRLPADDMSPVVKSWFQADQFLWAQLAGDGSVVIVAHTGGLASFDVGNPAAIRVVNHPFASDAYPSRMAVDADGERIYVSFRKTGLDLAVFRHETNGAFTLLAEKNDLNHTVAGLVPLPGGGVIVHSVSGIRNDSFGCSTYASGNEETYFTSADDIQDEGGDRFGNYNGLLTLLWQDGLLQAHSFIDLSGELSETQMGWVRLRNQSSMFHRFDGSTLLSNGRRPFAIGLDSFLFFTNPEWLNRKETEFNKYWCTDLLGIDAGPCYVSSTINGRINKTFVRAYWEDETALSPFNACTRQAGPLTCPDNFLVGAELFPLAAAGPQYILARGRTNGLKASASESLPDAAPLILINLCAPAAVRKLEPAYAGQAELELGHWVDACTFLSQANLAVIGGHDTMAGGDDLHLVDYTDSANPRTILNFGGDLYTVNDLLYVASQNLLFVANARLGTVQVYNLASPASPQLVASLDTSASTLAWSEKRRQLYVTGIYGAITIYTLTGPGSFESYQETFPGVGFFNRLVLNDELDLALASCRSFDYLGVGAHELLVLDFTHAGDTNRATGRIALTGRWKHPQTGFYVALTDVALSPDGQTGYAVIRNNNQYADIYRIDLANRTAPSPRDAVYNSTSITPLIGGIGLSRDGRYLACTRNGLDVFDLQNQAQPSLVVSARLSDPNGWPPYGSVEFSADGAYVLTGRVGYSNHALRIRLFK